MATTEEVLHRLNGLCLRLREEGGSRLPSERTLAQELNASRTTVRRALAALAADGLVTIERGRKGGAFLTGARRDLTAQPSDERLYAVWTSDDGKITRSFSKMTGIPLTLSEQGLDVGIRVLSLGLDVPGRSIAADLGLKEGEPAVRLVRLRFAGGEPLSLERMYLNLARFPHLVEEGLQGASSMYVLLKQRYGTSIASVEEEIEITTCGPDIAELLTIEPGAALLKLRRRAFDEEGQPVESSRDLFRGDRSRLTVKTSDPGPYQSTSRPKVGMRPRLRATP